MRTSIINDKLNTIIYYKYNKNKNNQRAKLVAANGFSI